MLNAQQFTKLDELLFTENVKPSTKRVLYMWLLKLSQEFH